MSREQTPDPGRKASVGPGAGVASGLRPRARRERIDRGIKARSDDISVLASPRDLAWLLLPRTLPIAALLVFPLLGGLTGSYWQAVMVNTLVIALLALSWDLLASVGLISLGQSFLSLIHI